MIMGLLARAVTSDALNMFLDSLIFFPLAFAYTLPWETVLSMIWSGIYTKIFIIFIDKPWFLAFRLLTKDVKRDV